MARQSSTYTAAQRAARKEYGGSAEMASAMGEHAENQARAARQHTGHFIAPAIKRPGALHRALDVPQDKPIPAAKVAKATKSTNPTLAKEARFAQELKGFRK